MKTFAILALLATLSAAAPFHQKRNVAIETKVVEVVEVITVTTTITLGEGESAPTPPPAAAIDTPAAATPTPEDNKGAQLYEIPAPLPQSTTSSAPALIPSPDASVAKAGAPPVQEITPPTQEYVPPPATEAKPTPADDSQQSSGSGDFTTGIMSYYESYGDFGSCGTQLNSDTDNFIALSTSWMGDYVNGASSPMCHKTITIKSGDKTVTVPIVDRCRGCVPNKIDASKKLYEIFGHTDKGLLDVSFHINA